MWTINAGEKLIRLVFVFWLIYTSITVCAIAITIAIIIIGGSGGGGGTAVVAVYQLAIAFQVIFSSFSLLHITAVKIGFHCLSFI